MIARMRTERTAAAAEQVHARRAVTGAARSLLPVHLLAGAPDIRTVLHRVRAGAAFGKLPDDAALNEIGARLESKNVLVQRDRACRLAVEGSDFHVHHAPPSVGAAAPFSDA